MKLIRVGDPHITVRNLEESRKLMDFIIKKAHENNVSHIEFMGDLFNNHAVKRVEVEDFWRKTFDELKQNFHVIVLCGNHDQIGSKEKEQEMNALNVFECVRNDILAIKEIKIVNKPMKLNNIAYIPHMSNHEDFLTAAKKLYNEEATEVLIAHQNFTVPLYSDMIDPNLIPQKEIITGHIHEQRQIGKVFQVGTPKWDTLTDANEDKGIWLFNHNENGSVTSKQFFSTKNVVTPIVKITVNEGDEDPVLNEKARNYLELVGSTAWITLMKKKYKGLAAIKARPSDRKHVNINKDKMFSIVDFLDTTFKPIAGVSKEDIRTYLKEVVNA